MFGGFRSPLLGLILVAGYGDGAAFGDAIALAVIGLAFARYAPTTRVTASSES